MPCGLSFVQCGRAADTVVVLRSGQCTDGSDSCSQVSHHEYESAGTYSASDQTMRRTAAPALNLACRVSYARALSSEVLHTLLGFRPSRTE